MNETDVNYNSTGDASDIAHGGGVFSFSERVAFLKKFGRHSMAFSALQPDMRYFDLEGIGYIAFRKKWGSLRL